MAENDEGSGSRQQIPVVDDLTALELYADNAAFFMQKGGNVTITLTSLRVDNSVGPQAARHVVVGHVVMPASAAQGLAIGLYEWLKKNRLAPDASAAN